MPLNLRGCHHGFDKATPVGRPTIYLDPQNSWAASLFAKQKAPVNFFAVGDALVTTNPALGAGCSFAATHVRVLADLLDKEIADPLERMQTFGHSIAEEQFWFFRAALKAQCPPPGPAILRRNRPPPPHDALFDPGGVAKGCAVRAGER